MGDWRGALKTAGIREHLAAAAAAVAVSAPLGLYVAYQQETLRAHQAGEAKSRADLHSGLLTEAVQRTEAATRLLPVVLQANHPQEAALLLKRLAELEGSGGSYEITPAGGTPLRLRPDDPAPDRAALPPIPPDATLTALGDPVWTVRGEELVLSQAVFAAGRDGTPRFWGYAGATLPFSDLVAAALLAHPIAEGFGVRLRHTGDGTAVPITLLAGAGPGGHPETRVVSLVRSGELQLEVQPRPALSAANRALDWGLVTAMFLTIYGLCLGLGARIREGRLEIARRAAREEMEQQARETEMASRIRAEELLERSHRLLDTIFEHLPGMVVIKRAKDLRIARVNRVGEAILGRSRDLVLGRSNEELYGAELASRLTRTDYQAMAERTVVELALEPVAMPGQPERWLRFRKVALFDAQDRAEYILEFGEDESERERLDMRLREHLNFLEQLLEAIPAPLFFKDPQGKYIGVNTAFERFVGRNRAELAGRTVFDFTPPQLAFTYHRADTELLQAGGSQIYESSVAGADGREREVIFHKAVFHATSGAAGGIVGIILDITERKQAEIRIGQLNRILTVLSETSQAIVRLHDRDQLLRMIARTMHERGGFPLTWVYLHGAGGEPDIITVDDQDIGLARRMSWHFLSAACQRGECVYCDTLACCGEALGAELQQRGLSSCVHLPLKVRGEETGGIAILGTGFNALTAEERRMLADLADNVSFALEAFADAEARRASEEKLLLSARVFENSSEGIVITDADNRILMVNQAFTTVTGYGATEVIGRKPSLFSSGRHDREFYSQLWESLHRKGEWRGEIENRRKDGEIYPEWLSISLVRNGEGAVTNYVAVFSDLTTRKEIEARLDFLSCYDTLTSLPNRRLFNERLQQALARPGAAQRGLALFVLDIDRFKLINDSLGQAAGDRILLTVAERLTAAMPENASICRLGGDEFAVIADEQGSTQAAASLARTIQRALRQAIAIEGHEIHLSAAIGISLFPADGSTIEELAGGADTAMYAAIADGGNAYRFFRQDMNSSAGERMRLESRLHTALDQGEFQVWYQPLVAAQSGRIVGAEALLRWHSPDFGMVGPDAFIPLLEETGLIVPVGEWVMRTACEENSRWRSATGRPLFVAVNLSALQLADEQLVPKVSRILSDLAFPPQHLEIELTESAVMRDAAGGIRTLNQLKDLGVGLSIDDFGTGYSSLSYLRQLPLDILKIDRSFILEIPGSSEAASIVRAVVALGHSLQLKIIAEGVEEPAQVEFLREAAVDILQGYHFSRPVPAAEFRRLVDEVGAYPLPEPEARSLHLAAANMPRPRAQGEIGA